MSYETDISGLSPDHFWTFDNTHNDVGVGANAPKNTGVTGTAVFLATQIAEDTTHSLHLIGVASKTECLDTAEINAAAQTQRTMGGWYRAPSWNDTVVHVYKEGGGSNNISIWLFPGNTVMAQARTTFGIQKQVFGELPLDPGRDYHFTFQYGAPSTSLADFIFFIDGVEQAEFLGDIGTAANFAAHTGDIVFGKTDVNLALSSLNLTGISFTDALYSHWASWTTLLTATQIRDTLFEKGAVPTHTVTNQAQLDALASSTINQACAIRVDVTGSISLSAEDIDFGSSSIHIQYTGTGTLTWTNSNGSNASIVSTPGGGTVTFVTSATLNLTVKDEAGIPVVGANAYIDDDNITPFIMNTTTDVNGVASVGHADGLVSNATWRVRKYGYKSFKAIADVPATGTKDIPVTLIADPQQV